MTQFNISFVIPVRAGHYPTAAIESIRNAHYPLSKIEVIVAQGNQPSAQRNEAVEKATGDVIYFLDDDSELDPDAIQEGMEYFDRKDVVAVGGPSITKKGANQWQRCFGAVLGAFWGSFITRFRHRAIGTPKPVRGEELILCNLMMKRDFFMKNAGLDPRIHPNEENELFKRLRSGQNIFYYNPRMIVRRPQRPTTWAFLTQAFRYGKGRSKHIFSLFHLKDIAFFVPTFFTFYLAVLVFSYSPILAVPLLVYTLLITVNSLITSVREKNPLLFFLMIPHFLILHVSYGLGLASGLAIRPWTRNPSKPEIATQKINLSKAG